MPSCGVPFLKMEGIGNDYVFFDALGSDLSSDHPRSDGHSPTLSTALSGASEDVDDSQNRLLSGWLSKERIIEISDRHYGVGGDGVVLMAPSEDQASIARMFMWNADGSESAICGNALRCVALHVHRRTGRREFILESGAGLHPARIIQVESEFSCIAEVEMGIPVFDPDQIPFRSESCAKLPLLELEPGLFLSNAPSGLVFDFRASILSMGNPHCVIFCEDADAVDLERLGPLIENDPHFPERTNVEFVSTRETEWSSDNGSILYQRTWERGSGETLACGSGACAVAVAARLTGRGSPKQRIQLKGGELLIRWEGSTEHKAPVFMRGPARLVYEGVWF